MLTRFWMAFLLPALINVAAGDIGGPYHPRFNSTLDGFTLFNKTTTFEILNKTKFVHQRLYLQKRNYNPENIPFNHTICLTVLTWDWDSIAYVLKAMFSVSPWEPDPLLASMVMNFSYDNRSQGYNILHSTRFVDKKDEEEKRKKEAGEPDYDYPPPQWQFLYVQENCTVVQLLDNALGAQARSDTPSRQPDLLRNCELWDAFDSNESTKCEEFFYCYCDTTNVTTVNLADICWGRTE